MGAGVRTHRTHRTVPPNLPAIAGKFPAIARKFGGTVRWVRWVYSTVGTVRWVRWVRYGGYAGYGTGGTQEFRLLLNKIKRGYP